MKLLIGVFFAMVLTAAVSTDSSKTGIGGGGSPTFTAEVAGTDAVSEEAKDSSSFDWIDGDCTNAGTGRATCTFVSGIFTGTPSCTAMSNISFAGTFCGITNASSTSVQIDCYSAATTSQNNSNFQFKCHDTGQ